MAIIIMSSYLNIYDWEWLCAFGERIDFVFFYAGNEIDQAMEKFLGAVNGNRVEVEDLL